MEENPYKAPEESPPRAVPAPRIGAGRWGSIIVGGVVIIGLNLAAHVAYQGLVPNMVRNTILVVGIAAALAYRYWARDLTGQR